jgi:sugar/nucleoside kinase (ribokinase family)
LIAPEPIKVIGVGSPILDLLAHVPDEHLHHVGGEKGGMELVDHIAMSSHVSALPAAPTLAPGGSAANTLFALAQLQMPASFLGKLGRDEHGTLYHSEFARRGGDTTRFKHADDHPTALCLSLVTPDSQRTMRTFLGAAALLEPHEVSPEDFEGHGHAHLEGYMLFNPKLMQATLEAAKAAGCTVSLSLGSFEVVRAARGELPGILDNYVDMVFANEDEARAFADHHDLEHALQELAKYAPTAAVTCGPDGALLHHLGDTHQAGAHPVDSVVDTTGAGDLWTAGFLFGVLNDYPLKVAAEFGAIMGAAGVQRMGASLDDAAIADVVAKMQRVVEQYRTAGV